MCVDMSYATICYLQTLHARRDAQGMHILLTASDRLIHTVESLSLYI